MRIWSICASPGLVRLSEQGDRPTRRCASPNASAPHSTLSSSTLACDAAPPTRSSRRPRPRLPRTSERVDGHPHARDHIDRDPDRPSPADFPVSDYNRIWIEESERFLEISKRAERLLVEGSGHQLQLERPEVVLEAILDIIDEARRFRAESEEEAAAAPMGAQLAVEERTRGQGRPDQRRGASA